MQDLIDDRGDVDVWEDNWDVLHLFSKYDTQWRIGMAGATGLDMLVFFHELDRKQVPSDLYDTMVEKLLLIEGFAMKHLHKKH